MSRFQRKTLIAMVIIVNGAFVGAQTVLFSESFDSLWPGSWVEVGPGHTLVPQAAHTGSLGVRNLDQGWVYNTAGVTVAVGDTISCWTRVIESRTYLGFDAGPGGCKSFVLAANGESDNDDIRFQENSGYVFTELNLVPLRPWHVLSPSVWYRMECELFSDGIAEGRLYSETGALISSVVQDYGVPLGGGGLALRAGFTPGHDADDVTVLRATDPRCAFASPPTRSLHSGDVELFLSLTDPQDDLLDLSFAGSTDDGVTWFPLARSPLSPSMNPSYGNPTPAAGVRFDWDTIADGIGMVGEQQVLLRAIAGDGTTDGECLLRLRIDNACCALPGDCDQSGSVTIVDALAAARHAVGLIDLLSLGIDGYLSCNVLDQYQLDVTIGDALVIARSQVGRGARLNCCWW